MRKTLKHIKKLYKSIVQSIAFFPLLISIGFFFLSLAVLSIETRELADLLKESIPAFYVQHTETARTLLSTVIGGILTLTVFSFSMVMLVLNQASSSYSPRLLPGLISDKKHQIILGIYTGTLLYCLLVLTSLGSYNASEDSVGFAAMLGSIFGIVCVGLFVYFIHRISTVIQIDHIIREVSKRSDAYLKVKIEASKAAKPLTTVWKTIYSSESGYYESMDLDLLPDSILEEKNQIEIIPHYDQHVWKGDPLFKVAEALSEEKLKQIELSIVLVDNRHSDHSYTGGMIKLMEIAVKAMSPGINDPGTAVDVITKLAPIILKTVNIPAQTIQEDSETNLVVIQNTISPQALMNFVMQPIRFYARMDVSVTSELVRSLNYIKKNTNNSKAKEAIENQLQLIKESLPKQELHDLEQEMILNRILE